MAVEAAHIPGGSHGHLQVVDGFLPGKRNQYELDFNMATTLVSDALQLVGPISCFQNV